MGYGGRRRFPTRQGWGEVAKQLHAISAGGASKLKWETAPVPIFLLCRFNNQGRSFDFSLHSVESACMGLSSRIRGRDLW